MPYSSHLNFYNQFFMSYLRRFTLAVVVLTGLIVPAALFAQTYQSTAAITLFNILPCIRGQACVIDPTATTQSAVNFDFAINYYLPRGYTLKIYDSSNLPIRDLDGQVGLAVSAGSHRTVSWNGRNSSGQIVQPGDYYYKFYVDGLEGINGLIRVQYSTVGTGQPQPAAEVTVTNCGATIDPTIQQTSTIYFSVNRTLTAGLTVNVKDSSGFTVDQLYYNLQQEFPRSGQFTWDGKKFDASLGRRVPVSAGPYRIVFISGGREVTACNVTVAYNQQPQGNFIVSHDVQPTSFDPYLGQKTTIYYTLGKTVYNFTLTIQGRAGNTQYSRILQSTSAKGPGADTVTWDGYVTNTTQYGGPQTIIAPEGDYSYVFTAQGESPVTGFVRVQRGTSPGQNAPTITDLGPVPQEFIPCEYYTVTPGTCGTTIRFNVNQDLRADVIIMSGGLTVRRVLTGSFSNNAFTNTINAVTWDGRNDNGQVVSDGNYTYVIDGRNANGVAQSVSGTIRVKRFNQPPFALIITDQGPHPSIFDPIAGQITRIEFGVNQPTTSTAVKIYRNNTFIRDLPVFNLGNNHFRGEWNGRDNSGLVVPQGGYTYRISATAYGETAEKSGLVEVRSAIIDPFPPLPPPPPPPPPTPYPPYPQPVPVPLPPYRDCGSFRDVRPNHPLCAAIEFVKSRGIFAGYGDGTLGLDRVIQRAELLAVMQKAFRYPVEAYDPYYDFDLGYRDLKNKTGAWYMPYLKTFSRLGLMVGYPDRTMRPERTMTTAELYVVFLKSALRSPEDVANFSLKDFVDYPPFVDTPVTEDTRWYLKYAQFAKINDLVITERFYPARGITRGQVIQLIYDMHRKGLISFPSPLEPVGPYARIQY